jgi:hypothetical protein
MLCEAGTELAWRCFGRLPILARRVVCSVGRQKCAIGRGLVAIVAAKIYFCAAKNFANNEQQFFTYTTN